MRLLNILAVVVFLLLTTIYPVVADDLPKSRRYYDYYASTPQYAATIDSAIAVARKTLSSILNDTLHYRPAVYIEDNIKNFKNRIGAAVPDWGAAVALPYRQMIVFKSPAHFRLGKSLTELAKHEYAHLALEDRLRHAEPPRWLNEGLAMYTAFEWGWASNLSLSQAVLMGSIVPLREIEEMNRFPSGRAQTAYAQSYIAVKYLLEQYGTDSFNILLDSLAMRAPVDSALMAATGSNYDGFEKEFKDYLKSRFNLLTIIFDMSYLWLFLAFVVIVGFALKMRHRKKKFDEWDEYEKYHSTDFDYGDPEQVDDEDKPWD